MNKLKFEKSKSKNKKYLVILPNEKKINFGDKRYEQFKDTTPLKLYSNLDHNDKKRQINYCKRSAGIKNKKGKLTKDIKTSANFFSRIYLWSCNKL